MTEDEMRQTALDGGFTYVVFMNTNELKFDAELRAYCVENTCGNYGKNYACPPDCGSPQDMAARVQRYDRALILESVQPVDSVMNAGETKIAKKAHNMISREFLNAMRKAGVPGLAMMAGPCTFCKRCARTEDKPCRFPEEIASCLSAYCVDAGKMAEDCGLPYWCGMDKVAFFSVFLFHSNK